MAMVSEGDEYTPVAMSDTELRASELPQPAAAASMLDTFGQSDRRITDDHNYDGSVPQVLALMNGAVTQQLTGVSSKVVSDLEELDGPDDTVRGWAAAGAETQQAATAAMLPASVRAEKNVKTMKVLSTFWSGQLEPPTLARSR